MVFFMNKKRIYRSIVAITLLASMFTTQFNTKQICVEARTVKQIEEEQKKLKKEISGLDNEIYSVVLEIQDAEDNIEELTLEIEDTKESLDGAKQAAKEQYAYMKIRIKYMYENGNSDITKAFFDGGDITSFLNRIEYVARVQTYDDDKMDVLESIVSEITELETALEEDLVRVEEEKKACEQKKKELDAVLAKKKKDMASLDKELVKAKEAARKAAELAAQKKAAEEKARQEALAKALAQQGTSGSSGTSAPTGGSASGNAVVAYACQFVGNPYVWGGTSLTNGCDCSGFVTSVYNAFGYNFAGGRLTSTTCRSIGRAVNYDEMQAGDIVCYSGHVGIYTGYGTIVEAQNTKYGITNNRSVNCHQILAIRRLL